MYVHKHMALCFGEHTEFCVECWHTDEHRLIFTINIEQVKRWVLFFASRSLSTPAAATAAADVPSIYSLNRKMNDAFHFSGG